MLSGPDAEEAFGSAEAADADADAPPDATDADAFEEDTPHPIMVLPPHHTTPIHTNEVVLTRTTTS